MICYGGAPMYLADLEAALDVFGPRLAQIYGQGETPMTITGLSKADHADRDHRRWRERMQSVGFPRTDVDVRVVDEAITTPEEQRATDNVVVLDIPLLAENPRKGLCGVIVVDVPVDVAVSRLVEFRGFKEDDARARVANQASRDKRVAIADRIVDNSGDMKSLRSQVDEVWEWAVALPPAAPDAGEQVPPAEQQK